MELKNRAYTHQIEALAINFRKVGNYLLKNFGDEEGSMCCRGADSSNDEVEGTRKEEEWASVKEERVGDRAVIFGKGARCHTRVVTFILFYKSPNCQFGLFPVGLTQVSPTLFNAGTPNPQLSSCFLVCTQTMRHDQQNCRRDRSERPLYLGYRARASTNL